MPNRTSHGAIMKDEIIGAAAGAVAKAAPPVTVAGAAALVANLDRVVVVLTIIYLVGQISCLGWRWVHQWRQRREHEGQDHWWQRRHRNHFGCNRPGKTMGGLLADSLRRHGRRCDLLLRRYEPSGQGALLRFQLKHLAHRRGPTRSERISKESESLL